MSNCRTGCPSQDHESWGACARTANLQVAPVTHDVNKQGERDLEAYRNARRQGLQPTSVRRPAVEAMKQAVGA